MVCFCLKGNQQFPKFVLDLLSQLRQFCEIANLYRSVWKFTQIYTEIAQELLLYKEYWMIVEFPHALFNIPLCRVYLKHEIVNPRIYYLQCDFEKIF